MTDEKEPVEIDYTEEEPTLIDAFDDSDPKVEQEIVEPTEEEEKGEEDAEPPAATEEKKEEEPTSVPLTALKDERSKRQSAEDKLNTAEQELAKYKQRSGDVPDPELDPVGFNDFMKDEAKVTKLNDRITMSAQIMSETKDDYAEMEAVFLGMGNKDPKLFDSMKASKNPALFAYKTAKTVHDKQEAAKVTATEELKASIRADLMKEFDIKPKPSEADKRKESALSTPNLTDATARGDNSTPVETSKFESEELFKDSPF